METYIIKVNGKSYEVEVSKKNEEAAVSGAAGAETQTEAKTNRKVSINMETYIIKVNGKSYEVEVSKKNEEAAVSGAAGAETQTEAKTKTQNTTGNNSPVSKNTSSGDGAGAGLPVTAGTSGKIWKISAKKGDMLKKGDTVLILEAMKMEIPVVASVDGRLEDIAGTSGKIWKISAKKGDMLKKGDTVLILEAMKMEIPVVASVDGRLEDITVSEGDTVEAGQVVAVMA